MFVLNNDANTQTQYNQQQQNVIFRFDSLKFY